uniref:Uncharacterized protein n=1 Tax=Rhizophora mucronata TaxID=61149 RepID=A0A2P2NN96_RHIMU
MQLNTATYQKKTKTGQLTLNKKFSRNANH